MSSPRLPRRRNGKEQACEPCRKAKIACDHGFPVCDRCVKRKVTGKCVYLPAPMTRPGGADYRTKSESSARRSEGRSTDSGGLGIGGVGVEGEGGNGERVGERDGDREASSAVTRPTPESGPFIKSGGFFGPTNFSAVFLENRENLGNGNEDLQISNDSEPYVASYESLTSQTFLMLAGKEPRGSPRVTLGAKVLRTLPDQTTCKFLLEWFYEKCHEQTFPKRGILTIANSIWATYGSLLTKKPGQPDGIEEISINLCKNAETALEEFEDYPDWITSCSGLNLRWESLGMVFSAIAAAILSLPERDAFFTTQRGERRNRRSFSVEMKDCVQACITLSNYMDLINVTMVALLCKNLVLQTVISGDASLVVWRQLGDLVAATTALGLHRQPETQKVTWLSQTKKRLASCVFNFDKGSSLLTGRPPALNYRYTRFTVPLDISEDVLMKGGEDLERAIAKLDANGWNTEGNIYPATTCRAHALSSPVLNEVLEMSLGDPEECTAERIKYLMEKQAAVYASYPPFLQFHLSDLSSPTCSDSAFFRRLILRLISLEHRLLLERLAHKHHVLSGQTMVDCARELLELTVLLWVQRDRFTEHHHDYDWMLMCWGIPSSGVLCVELLKQMKGNADGGEMLKIPRSEIVQNLSLLIGFLEWVKPAAGNYQLCGRMRIIIKRILDQILNPSPASSQGLGAVVNENQTAGNGEGEGFANGVAGGNGVVTGTGFEQQGIWDNGNGVGGQGFEDGMDNMDWLNTVDWSRGPWFDLGQDFSAARWG